MRLKPQSGKTFPPVHTKKLASTQNPKKIFAIVTLSFALDFERGTMAKKRRACSSSKCTKALHKALPRWARRKSPRTVPIDRSREMTSGA